VKDIVDRLMSLAECDARAGEPLGKCMRDAAAAITSLRAQVEELRRDIGNKGDRSDRRYAIDLERERDALRAALLRAKVEK
jgi:hypothetical protein